MCQAEEGSKQYKIIPNKPSLLYHRFSFSAVTVLHDVQTLCRRSQLLTVNRVARHLLGFCCICYIIYASRVILYDFPKSSVGKMLHSSKSSVGKMLFFLKVR